MNFLSTWAERYEATYGLPPMAGAETPEPTTPDEGTTATAEPGTDGGSNGNEPPEYIQQLTSRMDEVASRLEDIQPAQQAPGLVDLLASTNEQENGQPTPPQTPEPQEQAQPESEDGPDEAKLIEQYLQAEIQKGTQEAIRPLIQRQEEQRIRDEAQDFLEDYPEIREDPQTQQQLLSNAQRMAQELGTPDAAREPRFLELVHLASRQLAAQANPENPEGGGDQQQVALEPGGGTNPGPAGNTNDDRAAAIVGAKGHGLNSFWGGRG